MFLDLRVGRGSARAGRGGADVDLRAKIRVGLANQRRVSRRSPPVQCH